MITLLCLVEPVWHCDYIVVFSGASGIVSTLLCLVQPDWHCDYIVVFNGACLAL